MTVLMWLMALVCVGWCVIPTTGWVFTKASYLEDNNINTVTVRFQDDHFKQFYECLCMSQTSSCIAEYFRRNRISGYYIVTNQTKIDLDNQKGSSFYECNITHNYRQSGKIHCRKQLNICKESDLYQHFNFTGAESCNATCVSTTSSSGQVFAFRTTGSRFGTCQPGCRSTSNTYTDTLSKGNTVTDDKTVIIIGVVLSLLIVILLIFIGVLLCKKTTYRKKHSESNSQPSNTRMTLHNINTGYENSLTNNDRAESRRNDQAASGNSYSIVDSRNDMTNNNYYTSPVVDDVRASSHPPNSSTTARDAAPEVPNDNDQGPSGDSYPTVDSTNHVPNTNYYTSPVVDDNSARSNSPYSLAATGRVSDVPNDVGLPPQNANYLCVPDDDVDNYTVVDDNDINLDSASAPPYSVAGLETANDSSPHYINVNNNNVIAKTDDVMIDASSPYSFAAADSANGNVNTESLGLSTSDNNPQTSSAYSKLHDKVTKIKNPYDSLMGPDESQDQDPSLPDVVSS